MRVRGAISVGRTAGLLALLLTLLPVASSAESPTPEPLIVGGTPASITTAPWQVALLHSGTADPYHAQFCGGSILTQYWVVTAAHCIAGAHPSQIQVAAGVSNLYEITPAHRRTVVHTVVHPWYHAATVRNDIALLLLAEPLPINWTTIAPIALPFNAPKATWPSTMSSGAITGWGRVSQGGPFPAALHRAPVWVRANPSDALCVSYPAGSYVAAEMLCAGGGTDTCQGDSGGPLAHSFGGTTVLAGITSWGRGCNQTDYPGVYTRVTSYLTWLSSHTGLQAPPVVTTPVITSVTRVGFGEMRIEWTPLSGNEGTVSNYRVEAYLDHWHLSICFAAHPHNSCVVKDLGLGDTYAFRVQARYNGGWPAPSPWSPVVYAVPLWAPGPQSFDELTPGDTSITANWPSYYTGGTPNTSYEVEIMPGGQTCQTGAAPRVCTFTNLSNGTIYQLRLRAANEYGTGPWSDYSQYIIPDASLGFSDVPETSYFRAASMWLYHAGITTGYGGSPGAFAPDGLVTRGQMAALLHRLVGSPTSIQPHGFSDVPTDAFYGSALAWIKEAGVTEGYAGNSSIFAPDLPVTRAQMAAFLHRLAGLTAAPGAHHFGDVVIGAYYEAPAAWLKHYGVTTGYGGNPATFAPSVHVTRGQMAAFLHRLGSTPDAWNIPLPTWDPSP